MNKCLMTGKSGFLGAILQASINIDEFTFNDIQSCFEKKLNIINPFSLDKLYECDVIIHAAGKAHSVPRTPQEEQVFFDVNYQGTINLCNAIEQLNSKPKAFVFISTVAVYGLD